MLSTSRDVRRINSQITADNYTFDTVKEFVYLGSAATTKNDVSLEIKLRITHRCNYGLNGQLSNRGISHTTKLIHVASLWRRGLDAIKQRCSSSLRVFERILLGKILGPVRVGYDFLIRYNSEMYELLNDLNVVQSINIQRLRWLGHVVNTRRSAEVDEDERIKLRKPYHRLM